MRNKFRYESYPATRRIRGIIAQQSGRRLHDKTASGYEECSLNFLEGPPDVQYNRSLMVSENSRRQAMDYNAYWDSVYTERDSAQQSPFTEALHSQILSLIPSATSSILDAGCGGGSLMIRLAAAGEYALHGIDVSEPGIEHLVKNLRMSAEAGSITDMPQFADDQFDLVICSEVLEHLDDQQVETAVSEIFRVAKRNVILTCPYREKLGYHALLCQDCGAEYHICGHIRRVEDSFWRDILRPHSNEIKITTSGVRPLRSARFSRWLRTRGHSVIMSSDQKCMNCSQPIPYRRPTGALRQVLRAYSLLQRVSTGFGIHSAANYVVRASKPSRS